MRPKTIYYYESKRLEKHRVTSECMIEIVSSNPDGMRYRCQAGGHSRHDIYGWSQQKEAKADEIKETKSRIFDEQEWLKKLGEIKL